MSKTTSRLRVLSIAHVGVSRVAGRLRYQPLATDPDIDLRLIVPTRWHQFGRWYQHDLGDEAGLNVKPLAVRLPRAGPAHWYLHHYPSLGREVRAFGPDVIHLWEEPWSLVALHAALLASRSDAALVLEVDQNIKKRLPPPFEQIRRFVLRRTDLLLARSGAAADVARACGFVGPSLPIGYGVDQSTFYPAAAKVPHPELRLGFVGRLVAEKGIDDVLAAMAALDPARAPTTLAIMGEGPHEDVLRSHAAASGLGPIVTFRPWGGPDAVAALLRELDVLVLPTRTTPHVREQFGRVIIEAQACGVPVIGSDTGAIPDVIGDGGWIVPERDPAVLAALLARLAAAPAERHGRAAAGLLNVRTRFTYHTVAQDLASAWVQAHRTHHAGEPSAKARRNRALAGAGPR